MLETERKLHILTPLLWPSRCLYCSPDVQPEALGSTPSGLFREPPRSGVAFHYHIWSLLSGIILATASEVSEVPLGRVWLSLPHLVSSPLGVCWQLLRGFPRSPSVGCGLPYHISSLTLWVSSGNCSGGFPSSPSVGCGLPYHIWSLLSGIRLATAWDPNSIELNNNSTPTRSPTGSLNRMFNRHQAKITVMQFRGYSLPVHDCSGTMRPSPFPIS